MDAAWMRGYSLRCEPVDYSNSPEAIRVSIKLNTNIFDLYICSRSSSLLELTFLSLF